jgi:hypothetical protein
MPYISINDTEIRKHDLSIELYRSWERHPFTKIIQEILETEYFLKSAIMADSIKLGNAENIALISAEFKGKLQSLRLLIGRTKDQDGNLGELDLKELLDEYVEWNDVPKEKDIIDDNKTQVRRRTARVDG